MNLFSWLLVGHFVGDWLLQNDEMARGKRLGLFSYQCLIHCTIYSLTQLATLWIYAMRISTPPPYFLFAVGIFVTHWLIDATNLAARWGQWFKQTDAAFVRIAVDQTFHLITLLILVVTILE